MSDMWDRMNEEIKALREQMTECGNDRDSLRSDVIALRERVEEVKRALSCEIKVGKQRAKDLVALREYVYKVGGELRSDVDAMRERVKKIEKLLTPDQRLADSLREAFPAPASGEERCAKCGHGRSLRVHDGEMADGFIEAHAFVPPAPKPEAGGIIYGGSIDGEISARPELVGPLPGTSVKSEQAPAIRPAREGERRVWAVHERSDGAIYSHQGTEDCPTVTVVEQKPGETLRAVVAGSEERQHRYMFNKDYWSTCRGGCGYPECEHRRIAVLAVERP